MELGGYFIGVVVTLRGCWIIYNTRAFHWNMNFYICGCFFQWFEILAGKLMVMAYHKGWVIMEGNAPTKTYSEFYTSDISNMPKISSLWDYPLLLIGMLLITHYYIFSVISLTGLTIERSCATYWINDYESKKRPYISIGVYIFLQFFSAFVAYTGINLLFNVYYWICIGIGILIFNFFLFAYIWYWNVKIHRILQKEIPKEYTLQARFQAKENARSLNLIKVLVGVISICLLLESSFFVIQWTQTLKKYEVIMFFTLGFMNSQNPCSLMTLAMMSIPRWRYRYLKNFLEKFEKFPGVKKYILRPMENSVNSETEEYFKQLKNART